jgi:hypothetical protein
VDPGRSRGVDRSPRARAKERILADQRAVEVAGDCLDAAGKVPGELQPCGLERKSTRALRSEAGSVLYDFGITPFGQGAP